MLYELSLNTKYVKEHNIKDKLVLVEGHILTQLRDGIEDKDAPRRN